MWTLNRRSDVFSQIGYFHVQFPQRKQFDDYMRPFHIPCSLSFFFLRILFSLTVASFFMFMAALELLLRSTMIERTNELYVSFAGWWRLSFPFYSVIFLFVHPDGESHNRAHTSCILFKLKFYKFCHLPYAFRAYWTWNATVLPFAIVRKWPVLNKKHCKKIFSFQFDHMHGIRWVEYKVHFLRFYVNRDYSYCYE